MITEIYPVLLPALFMGGILSIIAGGGLGIIMLVVFSMFFDIRTSIVLMSLYGFVIQGMKIRYFHSYANWKIAGWYMAAGFPMSIVGGFLLYVIPAQYVQIGVSCMCVIFVVSRTVHFCPVIKIAPKQIILFGAINGIIGGIIGNATLLRTPILLSMGLKKEVFMGTSALISLAMNTGKVSAYMFHFEWSSDKAQLIAFSLPVVLVGMWLGKKILRYITPSLFEYLLLGIILIGALRLFYTAI